MYFGVTIDELFSLTDDAKLERIENMIDIERLKFFYKKNSNIKNHPVLITE